MKLLKWFARATGALALTLAGGCTQANSEEPASLAAAPEAGPALWKLTDEDTTIYLFGTVHALPGEIDWYDTRIASAFDASDELVTEIAMNNQATAQALVGSAMLADGQTLRALMSEGDRTEYEAVMSDLGLPPAALDPYEPWLAAMNLSMLPLMQSGIDPAAGVDMVLTQAGETKTKAALETIEQQIALFDEMPMDAQLAFLDSTVEAVPEAASTLRELIDLWVVGDADGLAAKMNEGISDPALYDRLLVQRNANWVNWIEDRLAQPGTVFIAVGAGHLAGADSVQEQLGRRGFEVERVWQ